MHGFNSCAFVVVLRRLETKTDASDCGAIGGAQTETVSARNCCESASRQTHTASAGLSRLANRDANICPDNFNAYPCKSLSLGSDARPTLWLGGGGLANSNNVAVRRVVNL